MFDYMSNEYDVFQRAVSGDISGQLPSLVSPDWRVVATSRQPFQNNNTPACRHFNQVSAL